MDDLIKKIKGLMKELNLGVNAIYKAKRGYIVSGYWLSDPDEPLDDCLFMLENGSNKLREYGFTENPQELTDATMKRENVIYSR